jgi:hypothetical protein
VHVERQADERFSWQPSSVAVETLIRIGTIDVLPEDGSVRTRSPS